MSLKKSNESRSWESGAKRDSNAGKSRPDLLSPFALMRLGDHARNGAVHYGDHNFCKGMPTASLFESVMRHTIQYWMGDTSEDHAAAAMWGWHAIMHMEEMVDQGVLDPKYDNRPNFHDPESLS